MSATQSKGAGGAMRVMRDRFDARTSTIAQCPMLSYHDGANACALESGHDDPHENHFGSPCEAHGWGERAAVIAYLGARYHQPLRRDHKGNVRYTRARAEVRRR